MIDRSTGRDNPTSPPQSHNYLKQKTNQIMTRTMTLGPKSSKSDSEDEVKKTRIDRTGRRLQERVERPVKGEPNSSLDYRGRFYSPRHDIVAALLGYLEKVTVRFPGVMSGGRRFKRFSSGDDVLKHVEYEELTRVGYRGHFVMKLIRDEFPTDFFVMESTERGPRLVCKRVADPEFLSECSRVRYFFDEFPLILDDSTQLGELTKTYVERCRSCDELVLKVCKLCC